MFADAQAMLDRLVPLDEATGAEGLSVQGLVLIGLLLAVVMRNTGAALVFAGAALPEQEHVLASDPQADISGILAHPIEKTSSRSTGRACASGSGATRRHRR